MTKVSWQEYETVVDPGGQYRLQQAVQAFGGRPAAIISISPVVSGMANAYWPAPQQTSTLARKN
jgi:hypothetical protein